MCMPSEHSPNCPNCGNSRVDTVIKALSGSEANDGVDHSGCIHRCEAIDDGHDHRIHLTVIAEDERGVTPGQHN